ncbi:MAG: DNA/RNA nuclease SfsA [Pseudomonadota bacterium]
MEFPRPLIPGTLIRRYKRFLADVLLEDGREVTAHCPNPGSMMGLKDPGLRVWLEPNDDPRKKLKYGWRLLELPGGQWVGIDATAPNRIVGEALRAGRVGELAGYGDIRAEQKYGTRSRIDFLLREPGRADAYVEIKNVHLMRQPGLAEFPDCVTDRGAKHLGELARVVEDGARGVMFYCIQMTGADRFAVAGDLDPAYLRAFDAARAAGVDVLVYDTNITTQGITLGQRIAF